MFLLRVQVVALFAIALLFVSFDRGVALKCYDCKSTNDQKCSNDPTGVTLKECKATTITPESTTAAAEVTTQISEAITPTPEATKPTPEATPPTPEATPSPEAITPTPEATKPTPEATPPTPEATTSTPESISSTDATSTADATTQTEQSTSSATNTTVEPAVIDKSDENPEIPSEMEPSVGQIFSRFRRDAMLRDDVKFTCYKLVYTNGGEEITERGCTEKKSNACSDLKNGKTNADCDLCDNENGCNGSSRINLGIMSILVPIGLVVVLMR